MAHTFDTKQRMPATANTTATTNPLTATFTPGAGVTVLVLAILYAGSTARGGGAPTFNGAALTQAGSQRYGTTSPECSCELWYLLSPPIGAYTVSIPNSGGLALSAEVSTYKAATGYSSALDVVSGQNGATSTNPTTASFSTTVNGDAIVAVVANGAQSWASTARTGTVVYDNDNGTWGGGSQYLLQSTAGSTTMSWTFGTSEDWGVQAVAFKEVLITSKYLRTKSGSPVTINNYLIKLKE